MTSYQTRERLVFLKGGVDKNVVEKGGFGWSKKKEKRDIRRFLLELGVLAR